jgi:iron complex outermembrane receptor protein
VILLFLFLSQLSYAAQVDPNPIIVEETKIKEYSRIEDFVFGLSADSGESLSSVPGIDFTRKGGHGNDPVIRGQKYNRLNIKAGERFIHGGCPSRMDPPSSYIEPVFYEEVEIHKGVHTLTEGRGGPGGTVIFRSPEPNLRNRYFSGKVGVGLASNSDTKQAFAQLNMGKKRIKGKLKYSKKEALSYQDGSNNNVNSSYQQQNSGATLYWRPSSTFKLKLKHEYDHTKDAKYTALGMDAPKSKNRSLDLKLEKKLHASLLQKIETAIYLSDVEHLMTNADRGKALLMDVDSKSKTSGGKLLGDFRPSKFKAKIGLDLQSLEQEAEKFHNANRNTYMWPKGEVKQLGLFLEAERPIGKKHQIRTSLRLDQIMARARLANTKANSSANSADEEFESVYGRASGDESELNLSALLRLESNWKRAIRTHFSLSKVARTADPSERFIHKDHPTLGAQRETGNPGLDPEDHLQLDAGIKHTSFARWENQVAIYYDHVFNFISKDRARGQNGISVNDGRVIYRNVDAILMGFELGSSFQNLSGYFVKGSFDYTYGKNTTDDRPLYEITPPSLSIDFGLEKNRYAISFRTVANLRQSRVDNDTSHGAGIDAGITPGWLIFGLKGKIELIKGLNLEGGVNNLFNRTYAKHLNAEDVLTASQVRVNEPGRSIWLKALYRF